MEGLTPYPHTAIEAIRDSLLAASVKRRARELGFDLVGIAPAEPSLFREYLRCWLDQGQAGSMEYLHRRFDERTDPGTYLPGAQSVICVALNYFVELEPGRENSGEQPDVPGPPEQQGAIQDRARQERRGRVARYALGDDYHEVIKSRLHALADWIRELVPSAQTRAAVDTAPLMEKDLAARAGIGWVGKNTCLINPEIGSWLLLGEIVTTLALAIDAPATDHCGSCTRCLDACPTGAITGPYQLDARRCISYLTIEHRGEIPLELRASIGDWLYGCDVCQDVCPHNGRAPVTADPALQPRFKNGSLRVDDILGWAQENYRAELQGSAMKRVKLPMLQRNARLVADNLERSLGKR